MAAALTAPWWVRPGLDIDDDGRLRIVGEDAEALAREHGTPLFVYDRARFAENARRLQAALAGTGLPFRVRFALKANPLPEILEVFRGLGAPGTPESVGIDACSPGEVERAIECGWRPDEISYTGTNVSERDLDVLLARGIHLNLDAISQIERYGRRAPGTAIGIRIDPGVGAGYTEHLEYAGDRPTKFGIGLERLDDAIAAAARHRLRGRHGPFPRGIGLAGRWPRWLRAGAPPRGRGGRAAARRRPPVGEVNVGGGLGAPARQDEQAVDLDAYAAVLARHLGPLGVTIACEPGDQLSKDAAILLGEVVTVERRRGVTFVGLDIGWNVNCSYFIYRFAQETRRLPGGRRGADRDRHGRRPHQRGRRRLRRGLPDATRRGGRHGRAAQRRRLPPGDELDPLPAPDGGGASSSIAEAARSARTSGPQSMTRSSVDRG